MADTRPAARRRTPTWLWVACGIALAIIAGAIALQVSAQRAQDRRVDTLYCTLSGITADDRGPRSGALCADLLGG